MPENLVVPVKLDNGSVIYVEVEPARGSECAPRAPLSNSQVLVAPVIPPGAHVGNDGALVSAEGLGPLGSFASIAETITGLARQIGTAIAAAKPDEASVELGLSAKYENGQLIGILVRGSGDVNLKITLTWKK